MLKYVKKKKYQPDKDDILTWISVCVHVLKDGGSQYIRVHLSVLELPSQKINDSRYLVKD